MPDIRWEPRNFSGIDVGFAVDRANGNLTVVHSQNDDTIRAILKNNAVSRRDEPGPKARLSGRLYTIANIPNGIVYEWMAKHGVDVQNAAHWPRVMELIHDPEYSQVRTSNLDFRHRAPRTTFIGHRVRSDHPLASNRAAAGRGGLIARGAF